MYAKTRGGLLSIFCCQTSQFAYFERLFSHAALDFRLRFLFIIIIRQIDIIYPNICYTSGKSYLIFCPPDLISELDSSTDTQNGGGSKCLSKRSRARWSFRESSTGQSRRQNQPRQWTLGRSQLSRRKTTDDPSTPEKTGNICIFRSENVGIKSTKIRSVYLITTPQW